MWKLTYESREAKILILIMIFLVVNLDLDKS